VDPFGMHIQVKLFVDVVHRRRSQQRHFRDNNNF
jgi:hypothetical protein